MILTQTHKRRSFVGSLNAGSELVESLRRLCVDNTILCGFFSGTGYLRDVRIRTFDTRAKRFTQGRVVPGTFHVTSLTGNISLVGKETSIRCQVMGVVQTRDGDHSSELPIGGELLQAEVIGLEFMLETVDDVRLYRDVDERSGLDGWLRLEFAQGGGNPIVRQTPKDPGEPAPAPAKPAREPAPEPVAPRAKRKAVVEEAMSSEEVLQEIRPGDFLNHPTLGRCEVTSTDLEDRLQIRLESGRVVELHTGLVDIAPPRAGEDGERVFTVSIRRRR